MSSVAAIEEEKKEVQAQACCHARRRLNVFLTVLYSSISYSDNYEMILKMPSLGR